MPNTYIFHREVFGLQLLQLLTYVSV